MLGLWTINGGDDDDAGAERLIVSLHVTSFYCLVRQISKILQLVRLTILVLCYYFIFSFTFLTFLLSSSSASSRQFSAANRKLVLH